jgi:hypothetical protein
MHFFCVLYCFRFGFRTKFISSGKLEPVTKNIVLIKLAALRQSTCLKIPLLYLGPDAETKRMGFVEQGEKQTANEAVILRRF